MSAPPGIALPDVAATLAFGRALGRALRVGDAVGLSGPLGAGKTVVARGVLEGLGFTGDVPSPSFPLVIAYAPPDVTLPLAHVDLYRVDDPRRLVELGLDDLRGDGAIVVEWPERLGARTCDDMLALTLSSGDDGARRLTARVPASWTGRWPLP